MIIILLYDATYLKICLMTNETRTREKSHVENTRFVHRFEVILGKDFDSSMPRSKSHCAGRT